MVVAIARQTLITNPGYESIEAWMFDVRGKRMDHLETSCSTREGSVGTEFANPGGELLLRAEDGFVQAKGFVGFVFRQDGFPWRPVLTGGPECPRDGLSGGKFKRVPP